MWITSLPVHYYPKNIQFYVLESIPRIKFTTNFKLRKMDIFIPGIKFAMANFVPRMVFIIKNYIPLRKILVMKTFSN